MVNLLFPIASSSDAVLRQLLRERLFIITYWDVVLVEGLRLYHSTHIVSICPIVEGFADRPSLYNT